jgi:hypothetical protein
MNNNDSSLNTSPLELIRRRTALREQLQLVERLANSGDQSSFERERSHLESLVGENREYLSRFFLEVGFPTDKIVGVEGASAAWEIVSAICSVDSGAFSALALSALKKSQGHSLPSPADYASLVDRVSMSKHGYQVYGSIWGMTVGYLGAPLWVPMPIDCIEAVDDRRSAIGLPALYVNVLENAQRDPMLSSSYLPSAYLLNYLDDIPVPEPEDPFKSFVNIAGLAPEWQEVVPDLLERAGKTVGVFAEAEHNGVSARPEVLNHIQDNFNFILKLCEDPKLGFPVDSLVGEEVATAAVRMVALYSISSSHGFDIVLKALERARNSGYIRKVPAVDLEVSLRDSASSRVTGLQHYGSVWLGCPALPNHIFPFPMRELESVDVRRSELGATSVYETARRMEVSSDVVVLLPIVYVVSKCLDSKSQ